MSLETHPPQLLQEEAQQKTHELVARISETLLRRLNSVGKDKLSSEQTYSQQDAALLKSLPRDSDHYDILNSLLTCEMIISELFSDSDWAEKIMLTGYENLTQFLQNFTLVQRVLHGKDRGLVFKALEYSSNHLDQLVGTLHSYPVGLRNVAKKNAFMDRHLNILEEARQSLQNPPPLKGQASSDNDELIRELRTELKELTAMNTDLKESLVKAEKELVQLEVKLIGILNERPDYDQSRDDSLLVEELKEELAKARMEIDRMDEQFRIEINVPPTVTQKYNEVFRSMENQIRTLREYHNIDVIEELETQIVRLREERQRDDMIIHELKQRERELIRDMNNLKGAVSTGYQSPRGGSNRLRPYPPISNV